MLIDKRWTDLSKERKTDIALYCKITLNIKKDWMIAEARVTKDKWMKHKVSKISLECYLFIIGRELAEP